MPRILDRGPAWLDRCTPGFQVFKGVTGVNDDHNGPKRTIAKRSTEIFIVAGNELRWADLPSLKDQWETIQDSPSRTSNEARRSSSHRVLQLSTGEEIRQLCVSPNENLMAIVTEHTVQIAILPPSELLNIQHNHEPIKLKCYTIGPTTHVRSQSPIATVLWHPLGVGGNCLITITADAVVRLWEFSVENRWSTESPTVAYDLRKLALAETKKDDILPNKAGSNKTFSADAAGMEVASACFGGLAFEDEDPWTAFTLWIAMKDGDVYAICPLLPSRWEPPPSLVPDLMAKIVESNEDQEHLTWIRELDNASLGAGTVYNNVHAAAPRLQGPFQLFPETDNTIELCDIAVVASKSRKTDRDPEERGLSATIVNLVTKEGRIYVCLDVQGVEAQWLTDDVKASESDRFLLVLEGLETMRLGEDCPTEWPTFSQDPEMPYTLFLTHSRAIYYVSFLPWLTSLEAEFEAGEDTGMAFRVDIFRQNARSLREKMLCYDQETSCNPTVPACLIWDDVDLGYMVLTIAGALPKAVILDRPHIEPVISIGIEDLQYPAEETISFSHATYQPSSTFYSPSSLPNFLATRVPARYRVVMKEELRLSTATLDVMTEAHRVIGHETHQLGIGAADLFRRCDQMLEILHNEVEKTRQCMRKVNEVTRFAASGDFYSRNEDISDERKLSMLDPNISASQFLRRRLAAGQRRQDGLVAKSEDLRRKLRLLQGKELTLRETAWKEELEGIAFSVGEPIETSTSSNSQTTDLLGRFNQVKQLTSRLVTHQQQLGREVHTKPSISVEDSPGTHDSTVPGNKSARLVVPDALRRRKVAEVEALLEQEYVKVPCHLAIYSVFIRLPSSLPPLVSRPDDDQCADNL